MWQKQTHDRCQPTGIARAGERSQQLLYLRIARTLDTYGNRRLPDICLADDGLLVLSQESSGYWRQIDQLPTQPKSLATYSGSSSDFVGCRLEARRNRGEEEAGGGRGGETHTLGGRMAPGLGIGFKSRR